MTPWMGRSESWRYMALMAAASAAASSPRPRNLAAAIAVASVTLTISRPRTRSSLWLSGAFATSDPPWHHRSSRFFAPQWVSQLLYADHLWLGIDVAVTLDRRKRLADRSLGGLSGDQHQSRWRAGLLA